MAETAREHAPPFRAATARAQPSSSLPLPLSQQSADVAPSRGMARPNRGPRAGERKWKSVGVGACPAEDPVKLAAAAPAWMKLTPGAVARQRAALEAGASVPAAAAAAKSRATRSFNAANAALAAANAASAAAAADLRARVEGRRPRRRRAEAVGDLDDLNLAIFADPVTPQWWGVHPSPSEADVLKATTTARWLGNAIKALGPVGCVEAAELEKAAELEETALQEAAAAAVAAGQLFIPPRKPPPPPLPARAIEVWVPKKKIKAHNLDSHKVGVKTVAYQGGRVVFFKAVLDRALANYVTAGIANLAGGGVKGEARLTGWAAREVVDGVQVPLPLGEAEIEAARAWEAEPEEWGYARAWLEEHGPGLPPPPLPPAVAAAHAANAAEKAAKAAAKAAKAAAKAAKKGGKKGAATEGDARSPADLAAEAAATAALAAAAVAREHLSPDGMPAPRDRVENLARDRAAWAAADASAAAAAAAVEGAGLHLPAGPAPPSWTDNPALLVGWTVGLDPAREAEGDWAARGRGGRERERERDREVGADGGPGGDADPFYAPRGGARGARGTASGWETRRSSAASSSPSYAASFAADVVDAGGGWYGSSEPAEDEAPFYGGTSGTDQADDAWTAWGDALAGGGDDKTLAGAGLWDDAPLPAAAAAAAPAGAAAAPGDAGAAALRDYYEGQDGGTPADDDASGSWYSGLGLDAADAWSSGGSGEEGE